MKKSELIKLGFERVDVAEEESGSTPYYYYALSITDGLEFITPPSDKFNGEEWRVEIFNLDTKIVFREYEDLKKLIDILNKHKINKK